MIEGSSAKRAGTPDEVASVAALLMGPDGGFITGSGVLMDGGVAAAYRYGDIAEVRAERGRTAERGPETVSRLTAAVERLG